MDTSELRERVERVAWFHSIDVGHGVVTPGSDRSVEKLERLAFPERLDGLSVLDVGAWNGFFSFEAEKRGAERVLAVDSFCWSGEGSGTKDAFLLARELLDSQGGRPGLASTMIASSGSWHYSEAAVLVRHRIG